MCLAVVMVLVSQWQGDPGGLNRVDHRQAFWSEPRASIRKHQVMSVWGLESGHQAGSATENSGAGSEARTGTQKLAAYTWPNTET